MPCKNLADHYAYLAEYRAKRILLAQDKLGGKCTECGSLEDLHFHHKDPSTKVKNVASLANGKLSRFWAEVDKCCLLCGDCHRRKHSGPAHGSTGYRKGCRCEICSKANREAAKAWYDKKKETTGSNPAPPNLSYTKTNEVMNDDGK